jgi:hypothetical protein
MAGAAVLVACCPGNVLGGVLSMETALAAMVAVLAAWPRA